MSHDKHLRCSFCGKSKDSVRKFISGPSVYICNECIALCNEILAEEASRANGEPGTWRATARRTPGDAGDAVIAPTATRRLLERFLGDAPASQPDRAADLAGLTLREREILGLVGQGLTNGEIAGRLFLSEGTVKNHIGHILAKLSLRDRIQAVILAYQTGLVHRDNT